MITDLKFGKKYEGLRLIKKAKYKGVKVIALTGVMLPEIFAFANRLGANAIMDKFVTPEVMLQIITAATDHPEERWVNNKELVDKGRWFVESFEKFIELKPVEKLIVQLIGAGKTTREIADELQLVERTVSNYRYKLNDRLDIDENKRLYELSKLVDNIPVKEIE